MCVEWIDLSILFSRIVRLRLHMCVFFCTFAAKLAKFDLIPHNVQKTTHIISNDHRAGVV